jgi:EmrB/QacA subfamily drug resistance transporter
MAAVAISVFIFSLDYSMLNISLPIISRYFRSSLEAVAWLPLVYLVIVTSTLLVFGKLGDLKGLKKIFIAGMAIFLAGTVSSSVSPNMPFLLVSRIVQSLGEAMFNPLGIAIITTFLPAQIRGKGIGVMMLAQGLGFMLGSAAGGYLNSHFSWRAIFIVNVPITIAAMALAAKAIPGKGPSSSGEKFDLPGSALLFTALISFIYVLNNMGKASSLPVLCAWLALSAVLFALFVMQERRSRHPLLDLGLFRNRDFTFANISAFLMLSALMGTVLVAPFFLELVSRLSVLRSGTFLMVPPFMMMIFSPLSGKLADRIGSRPLCASGAAVAAAGFLVQSSIGKDSSHVHIILCLVALGAGVGLFMPPNGRLVMSLGPRDKQGMVAGVYKIGISIGGIFGIAVMPLVIRRSLALIAASHGVTVDQARLAPEIMAHGFQAGFIFAAIVCAAAFAASLAAKDGKA